MRIGINVSFVRKPASGIGQVTINFLKELVKQESRHEFILYLEEDLPRNFKLPKNFTKRIFLPLWKRDDLIRKIWWEKYLLPQKVKEDRVDIFFSLYQSATLLGHPEHSEGSRANAASASSTGFFANAQNDKRVKHIMLAHDIIPKLFPEYLNNSRKKYYWRQIEKAIRSTDKIIANSRRTEKDLVQHLAIDPAKITVDYLDVDEIYKKTLETHRNASVLKKYKLKPGYIYNGGGLEVRKNTEGVIRAYKYLLEKNKTLHFIREMPQLVISGKLLPRLAPLVTDVEKLVKELNLTKQVKILDFMPQEHLPTIYANAIMFIYPSRYEGFGIPVLEAMNQGTPVIAAKTSSLPEVGGDAVLYCDPDDIKDIAMVMRNILLNENLRQTLARRGKERAKNFSWEKFVKKFLNIAKSL